MIKKITLIALALVAFSNVFAQMNAVIYSEAGEKFTLYLNGEAMNSSPLSNVKLQGLTSEFYQARVDFQDAALADFSNNNFALHPGMEVTYQIKKNKKGEYVLRFYTENPVSSTATSTPSNNNIKDFAVADDVPPNTTPTQTNNNNSTGVNTKTTTSTSVAGTKTTPNNGGSVGMNINVDGVNMGLNVNVDESGNGTAGNVGMNVNADGVNFGMNVNVDDTNSAATGGNVGMNINVDGMNMGINMNVPDMNVQTSGTTTTSTTTKTTTSSSSSNSTVPAHTTRPSEPANNQPTNTTIVGNGNCTRSMDAASFGKAKQTIESKGFDDTKLSTAKQVAKANCLTTDQILEIMKIFGFEDSRLEFAKYAYDFCFDQNNYYTVGEGFSFDSSTEELNEYIETK
jgi:hypothetical protein